MTGKTYKAHIDENGDRYLNIQQAAELLCSFSRTALDRWAEAGKTSFGFKLHTKVIPIHGQKNARWHGKAIKKRLDKRTVILEADMLALREIERFAGRTKRGNLSPYDRDVLEARADAFIRLQARQKNHCLTP